MHECQPFLVKQIGYIFLDAIGLMNSGAERASFLISGLGSWVRPCLLGPKLSVDRSTEFLDWSLGIRGSISRSLPHKQ